MQKKAETVIEILNKAKVRTERDIVETVNRIRDLKWDLSAAEGRVEYLQTQLNNINEHIQEVEEDHNNGN